VKVQQLGLFVAEINGAWLESQVLVGWLELDRTDQEGQDLYTHNLYHTLTSLFPAAAAGCIILALTSPVPMDPTSHPSGAE
jgi:hypothetical protein